jgi:hypothetical protein
VDGIAGWIVCLAGCLVSAAELEFVIWVSGLRGATIALGAVGNGYLLVMDEPSTSWEGNGRLQRGRLEMKDGWLVMGGAPDRCMHGIASSVSFHFECMYVLSRVDDLHF